MSVVILGGLLAAGAACRDLAEHESSGEIAPKADEPAIRGGTPPTSRELFVFQTMARAESLATTQGLRVAPPQESGAGVPAPSRVGKGEKKRHAIKGVFLAEAGHRVAQACGLSIEDIELIYRRGIEERWPRDEGAEERVSSNWCGQR